MISRRAICAHSVVLCAGFVSLCSTATLPQSTAEPHSVAEPTAIQESLTTDYSLSTPQCFSPNKRLANQCGVGRAKRRSFNADDLKDDLEIIGYFINDTVKETIFKNYITNDILRSLVQQYNMAILPKDFNSVVLNQGNEEQLSRTLYVSAAAIDYVRSCGTTKVVESQSVDLLRNLTRLINNALCRCNTDLKAGLGIAMPPPESMLSKDITDSVLAANTEMDQYILMYIVVQEIERNIRDLEVVKMHTPT